MSQKLNRGNHTETNFEPTNITILDNDRVVINYIKDKINPQVKNRNGEMVKVPVVYGDAERWHQIKKSGVPRSADNKLEVPLIMVRRVSIDLDKNLTRKLSTRHPQIVSYIKKYSKKNRYDNFSVLTGEKPVYEMENIVVPTYLTLQYDLFVWTSWMEQMNSIQESLIYPEGTYWYDDKHHFYVFFDNLSGNPEVVGDQDRVVRSNVSLTIKGFVLPDTEQLESQVKKQGNTIRRVVVTEQAIRGI